MRSRQLLLTVLLLFSCAASANGYIGFGVGNTSVKVDLSSLGGGSLDENSTLSKLYGGYRFNKYVSLEAAYFGLAQASVAQLGTPPNDVSGSVDMKALGLYGVAFASLSKSVEVYIKAGGAMPNSQGITRQPVQTMLMRCMASGSPMRLRSSSRRPPTGK